jgi:hypothetical protein
MCPVSNRRTGRKGGVHRYACNLPLTVYESSMGVNSSASGRETVRSWCGVCDSSSNTWTNCGSRNNTDDSSGSGGISAWKWEEEGMGDMGDGRWSSASDSCPSRACSCWPQVAPRQVSQAPQRPAWNLVNGSIYTREYSINFPTLSFSTNLC